MRVFVCICVYACALSYSCVCDCICMLCASDVLCTCVGMVVWAHLFAYTKLHV